MTRLNQLPLLFCPQKQPFFVLPGNPDFAAKTPRYHSNNPLLGFLSGLLFLLRSLVHLCVTVPNSNSIWLTLLAVWGKAIHSVPVTTELNTRGPGEWRMDPCLSQSGIIIHPDGWLTLGTWGETITADRRQKSERRRDSYFGTREKPGHEMRCRCVSPSPTSHVHVTDHNQTLISAPPPKTQEESQMMGSDGDSTRPLCQSRWCYRGVLSQMPF
jgi:hypothetical protein